MSKIKDRIFALSVSIYKAGNREIEEILREMLAEQALLLHKEEEQNG